jgi:hypothetical protein
MRRNLNCCRPSFALLLAAVLVVSCRPRSSALDCDFNDWQNPSIIVEADGVEVVLFDGRTRITMGNLRDYLSELPNRYWRQGRIVAIDEGGLRAPHTDNLIRSNMEQTKRIVESLGIQICPNKRAIAALLPHNNSLGTSRDTVLLKTLL